MGLQKEIIQSTKVVVSYINICIRNADFDSKRFTIGIRGYTNYTDRINGATPVMGGTHTFTGDDFTFSKKDTIDAVLISCYEKLKALSAWSDATDVLEK